MNTFFRLSIYFSFGMIIFTLAVSFIFSLGAFPLNENPAGIQDIDDANALTVLTGLSGGMEDLWLMVTMGTGVIAIGLAILTRSMTPIGLHIFSLVFWTAYTKTNSILNMGGYLPAEFLVIFTVGMVFLFIAAIIGMLVGSG